MTSAGFQLLAGRIPGERIATTVTTSNSSTFTTTETQIASVTASLVSGRTYRVRWIADVTSTAVADDVARPRLREDSVSGTVLNLTNVLCLQNRDVGFVMEAEYTAVSSGDKTFVGTCQLTLGSGTLSCNASSTEPAYLYVDYIRG